MNLIALAAQFRKFAVKECAGACQLYACLSEGIAADADLLQLAAHHAAGQPAPNLFFAAVHDLLLRGIDHDLRNYYANLVVAPRPAQTAFPVFKDFCILHRSALIGLLQTKRVQTNEVRRCAYLYPAFCYIYAHAGRPLALIEIGTSAGLQLLWDQYAYSYNASDIRYGSPHAPLHIQAALEGDRLPPLHRLSPPVAARIGIDLHVSQLDDPDDHRWMQALIWPEAPERLAQFALAADLVQQHAPPRITGDGVLLLPEIAASLPQHAALCVFHTHVANQFPATTKDALIAQLRLLSSGRDVFHLYNNMQDTGLLHLDIWRHGQVNEITLAEIDGHGRWFTWQAS